MSTDGLSRVDSGVDDISTTRVERFLAVVLAVFVLIGLLWVYAQPLDRTDDGRNGGYGSDQGFVPGEPGVTPPVPATAPGVAAPPSAPGQDPALGGLRGDALVLARYDQALERERQAAAALALAQDTETRRREAYRTELDAGRPGTVEQVAYVEAQGALTQAEGALAAATAARTEAEPAARAVRAAQQTAAERDRTLTFWLRLGWVVGTLGLAFALLDRLRRRRSRWLPLGGSVVAATTVQAAVMTGDYLDVQRVGPIVLSLVGVALTVSAFVGYQRWLARRLAPRRVRREECPYCGHPARHGRHCVGCGRSVLADCTACGADRRVGSRFCAVCGSAGTAPVAATVAVPAS